MSQYIFDQVYGSQARKKKILSSNSFLYYRQIMKIKNNHMKNPQLYTHVYETLTPQSPHSYRSKPLYSPDFLSTLDRNNYAIQTLNPHAFKIIKRRQKVSSVKKSNQNNNDLIHMDNNINSTKPLVNKFVMSSERKITARTISRDQHELREYLNRSQRAKSKAQQRQKNMSLSYSSDKKIATPTTLNRTQRTISPFSTIRHQGISFIRL